MYIPTHSFQKKVWVYERSTIINLFVNVISKNYEKKWLQSFNNILKDKNLQKPLKAHKPLKADIIIYIVTSQRKRRD